MSTCQVIAVNEPELNEGITSLIVLCCPLPPTRGLKNLLGLKVYGKMNIIKAKHPFLLKMPSDIKNFCILKCHHLLLIKMSAADMFFLYYSVVFQDGP